MNLEKYIRNIPDFPKPGIQFKDITPLLGDADAFKATVDKLIEPFVDSGVKKILGMESRGFIFGTAAAIKLGVGFAPVRKPNKLPHDTHSVEYQLEYGTDSLELHKDAFEAGDKVLIIDDLLATGGTAEATSKLVNKLGGQIVGYSFVIELAFLNGREKLGKDRVHSLITYS